MRDLSAIRTDFDRGSLRDDGELARLYKEAVGGVDAARNLGAGAAVEEFFRGRMMAYKSALLSRNGTDLLSGDQVSTAFSASQLPTINPDDILRVIPKNQ